MGNCLDVGDANPDIAGIGVLVAFMIQAAIAIIVSMISICLKAGVIGLFRVRNTRNAHNADPVPEPSVLPGARRRKIIELLNEALTAGNDTQLMTGTALLLSGIVQYKTLPFYHLHIIYDTVSFVAISICAATASSFHPTLKGIHLRYVYILIWSILYLTYTILFGIRLRSWNYDTPGLCYNTSNLALPNASHPYVDNIYISLTYFYVIVTLSIATGVSQFQYESFERDTFFGGIAAAYISPRLYDDFLFFLKGQFMKEFIALGIAALQFPLHLYSIFTLRASNEHLLNSGTTEQQWGFGQIVAVVILGQNMTVLLNGISEYRDWSFERDHPGEQRKSNLKRFFANFGI